MRIIEDIIVPLCELPEPEENYLLAWRVADGSHVVMGQVLFDLKIGKNIHEIESLFTGYIKIEASKGKAYRVGDHLGRISCEENVSGALGVVGVDLTFEHLARLDAIRGELSRRECLTRLLGDLLSSSGNLGG